MLSNSRIFLRNCALFSYMFSGIQTVVTFFESATIQAASHILLSWEFSWEHVVLFPPNPLLQRSDSCFWGVRYAFNIFRYLLRGSAKVTITWIFTEKQYCWDISGCTTHLVNVIFPVSFSAWAMTWGKSLNQLTFAIRPGVLFFSWFFLSL